MTDTADQPEGIPADPAPEAIQGVIPAQPEDFPGLPDSAEQSAMIAVRFAAGCLGHRAGDVAEIEETAQVRDLIEAGYLVRLIKAVE